MGLCNGAAPSSAAGACRRAPAGPWRLSLLARLCPAARPRPGAAGEGIRSCSGACGRVRDRGGEGGAAAVLGSAGVCFVEPSKGDGTVFSVGIRKRFSCLNLPRVKSVRRYAYKGMSACLCAVRPVVLRIPLKLLRRKLLEKITGFGPALNVTKAVKSSLGLRFCYFTCLLLIFLQRGIIAPLVRCYANILRFLPLAVGKPS